jgi:hypothetical protein
MKEFKGASHCESYKAAVWGILPEAATAPLFSEPKNSSQATEKALPNISFIKQLPSSQLRIIELVSSGETLVP